MKRRAISLALAGMMILALGACSKSNSSGSQSAVPETQQSSVADSTDSGTTGNSQAPVENAPAGYPSKNISWIVPADAGAPLDIPTRVVIENMDIDTNVIVENIPGASNTIGTLETANRPADGYTILTSSSSALIITPLREELAYDPTDFRLISLLKPMSTYAVVVGPKSPVDSADDIIALMQSGERFTYTVSNAGAASHLSIVDALKQLNVESGVYVPYNGGAEVTAALMNLEVDFAVLDTPAQLQSAALGDVKVLLIMSDEADPLSPDTPYIGQYGVTGMDPYFSLQCIAVHKDTPEEIVTYLKQVINNSIMSEAYQDYLEKSGVGEMAIMEEAEIEARASRAREVYKQLLKELGMI